jgi:hypothetical protein
MRRNTQGTNGRQRPKKEVAEAVRGAESGHKTGLKDAGLIASQDFFERANEALAEKS